MNGIEGMKTMKPREPQWNESYFHEMEWYRGERRQPITHHFIQEGGRQPTQLHQ